MNSFHKAVLLQETIEALRITKGSRYIDATIGGGGHAGEILKRGGIVLGLDVDKEALEYVEKNFKLEITNRKLTLAKGNFRDIEKIAHLNGFDRVSGIIFDLGVSSHQLETAERGFSFQKEAPLDMRMDKDLSVKASDLINALTKGELYELFTKLGEENGTRGILKRIIRARRVAPIETTKDLVRIIEGESRVNHSRINRATRIFQALRIAVNDELSALKEALPKGVGLLEKGGRILVISFHSLEDRIVKRSFLEFEKDSLGKVVTKKPIRPGEEEVRRNRRARSAKLRIFEIRQSVD